MPSIILSYFFAVYRWTVRAKAVEGVLANYNYLLVLLADTSDTNEADVKARMNGAVQTMSNMHTLFGMQTDQYLNNNVDISDISLT